MKIKIAEGGIVLNAGELLYALADLMPDFNADPLRRVAETTVAELAIPVSLTIGETSIGLGVLAGTQYDEPSQEARAPAPGQIWDWRAPDGQHARYVLGHEFAAGNFSARRLHEPASAEPVIVAVCPEQEGWTFVGRLTP